MRVILSILLSLMAWQASAQQVRDCDGSVTLDAVPEPWADYTRTFAGNRVRLVVLDMLEPAAAAFQLVVLSPPFDELGQRQCKIVGSSGTLGFGEMSLNGLTSSYDPEKGLTWGVPINVYNANTSKFDARTLDVTLNQVTGDISARLP